MSMTSVRRRAARGALAALLVGAAWSAMAPAIATAGLPASAKWAWVVVRQATGDQTPAPKDRGNSSGGVNTVTDISATAEPGTYRIDLPGVAPAPGQNGNVLVSTLGTAPRICAYDSLNTTDDDVSIVVYCFKRDGQHAPATFVLNWLAAAGVGGRLAYATDWDPSSDCGDPVGDYHSLAEEIDTCVEDGRARVLMPELGSSRGHAQVSAQTRRTDTGYGISAGYCGVTFFGAVPPDGDEAVDVACFDPDGSERIERAFGVWFMQGLGMKGIDRTNVAYLLAGRPKAASYPPGADRSYSSAGRASRVERLGKGRYRVTLPGMKKGGSAQVTPLVRLTPGGAAVPRHCVLASIERSSLPQRVGVRCFDEDGRLADSRFLLAYAK